MSWFSRIFASGAGQAKMPQFTVELPAEPVQIVWAFIADYHRWNDYVYRLSEADQSGDLVQRLYEQLIAHYCGPAKRPQLPTYGSHSTFTLENCSLGDEKGDDKRRMVAITVSSPDGYPQSFECDLTRNSTGWLIDELYYLDKYDGNARLKYL
jgi:hypothetical protein